MGGNVGFLSSSSGRLRVPVKLQQVTQSSARVLVGSQGSSQVVAWDTEFHSSHGGELGVPLELGGVFRVHLKLPWGLLSTSPGTSCLVQGCLGGGFCLVAMCGCILSSFGMGLYSRYSQGQLCRDGVFNFH